MYTCELLTGALTVVIVLQINFLLKVIHYTKQCYFNDVLWISPQ